MGHSLGEPASVSTKLLGAIGIAGGLLLIAAYVPSLPWTADLFNLRLVVFNAGAIAIAIAIYRRHSPSMRGQALVAAGPAILANAWYLVLILRAVTKDGQVGGGDYDPSFNTAALAMWLSDAWLGFTSLRLGQRLATGWVHAWRWIHAGHYWNGIRLAS